MKDAICVLALLCVVYVSMVSSQAVTWDYYSTKCTEVGIQPMNNFKKEQYWGIWYVQEMYDFTGSDANNCYTSLRLPSGGETGIKLDAMVNLNLDVNTTDSKVRINGLLTFNKPGYGQFIFNSTDENKFTTEVRIIEANDKYSIEYSCLDVDGGCLCWLIALSRERSISSEIQNEIYQIIDDNHLDKTKLRKVKQDLESCLGTSTELGGLLGGLLEELLEAVGGLLEGLLEAVGGVLSSLLG